jgi:hypothetical protein
MELLSFEGGSKRPRNNKKTTKVMAAIGAMAVFAALGSTLAANITINSGSSVQFGQGLTGAAACSNMSIAPQDTFTNGSNTAGTFTLSGFVFTNLNDSSSGCAGDTLTIRAWDSTSGDAALTLSSLSGGISQIDVPINASGTVQSPPQSQVTLASHTDNSSAAGAFTVNINSPGTYGIAASNVYKVTVESHQ